jgi:hypothetical protein
MNSFAFVFEFSLPTGFRVLNESNNFLVLSLENASKALVNSFLNVVSFFNRFSPFTLRVS